MIPETALMVSESCLRLPKPYVCLHRQTHHQEFQILAAVVDAHPLAESIGVNALDSSLLHEAMKPGDGLETTCCCKIWDQQHP